jgi:hypothetical protein
MHVFSSTPQIGMTLVNSVSFDADEAKVAHRDCISTPLRSQLRIKQQLIFPFTVRNKCFSAFSRTGQIIFALSSLDV